MEQSNNAIICRLENFIYSQVDSKNTMKNWQKFKNYFLSKIRNEINRSVEEAHFSTINSLISIVEVSIFESL